MWIGSWKDRQDNLFGIRWVTELPLLGATFSVGDYTKPTWEKPVAKLEHRLSSWQGRQLSLQGKATVINVLALSQIWHLCHVFPIPEWANKRITKAVWSFFWSGNKDLVARATVCLPKSQGGFGVINFKLKAEAFALQWVKRFFNGERAKWKDFFAFFFSSCLGERPRAALLRSFPRRQLSSLPPYYQLLCRTWRSLEGGLAGGELSLSASSDKPLQVQHMSSKSTYVLARNKISGKPHCVSKFAPTYGPLHWSQTWDQLHFTSFDRVIIDLNWKIAHGVLYTGARLAHRFKMSHVDGNCFCRADEETLEHLFFECELARLLVGWVYFNLMQVDPVATPFSVVELLFGFSLEQRRSIPLVIIWMLHVMKHVIWGHGPLRFPFS
jgi:hypothetical protein